MGESHALSWSARGWEAMFFFVCFLYSFKAAAKMVSKFGEEVDVDGTWDIMQLKRSGWMARTIRS